MRLSDYLTLSKRTKSEIAQICGVSVAQISRIASGKKKPSLDLIAKIRDATDGAVSADDWLPPFTRLPAPDARPSLAAV